MEVEGIVFIFHILVQFGGGGYSNVRLVLLLCDGNDPCECAPESDPPESDLPASPGNIDS